MLVPLLQVKSSWSRRCYTVCVCWSWLCRRRWPLWICWEKVRHRYLSLLWNSSCRVSVLRADGLITSPTLPGLPYIQICHMLFPAKSSPPKSCQECFNVSNTWADLTCLALTGTCTTAARTLMLLSRVPRFCAVSHATQTSRPGWLETSHMIRQENSHCLLLIQLIGVALNMTKLFCNEQMASEKLMAGFVECLDSEEAQEGVAADGESLCWKWSNIICKWFKAAFKNLFFLFVQTQTLRNGWPGFVMKPRFTSWTFWSPLWS